MFFEHFHYILKSWSSKRNVSFASYSRTNNSNSTQAHTHIIMIEEVAKITKQNNEKRHNQDYAHFALNNNGELNVERLFVSSLHTTLLSTHHKNRHKMKSAKIALQFVLLSVENIFPIFISAAILSRGHLWQALSLSPLILCVHCTEW